LAGSPFKPGFGLSGEFSYAKAYASEQAEHFHALMELPAQAKTRLEWVTRNRPSLDFCLNL
jgi:hypothetical protein